MVITIQRLNKNNNTVDFPIHDFHVFVRQYSTGSN